jgi:gluconate kinase
MPASLLDSQLAALEEPLDAITVDVSGTPAEIVAAIMSALGRA